MPETLNVSIIGSGQIGSRHLQALAHLQESVRIQLVDPSQSSLEVACQRFHSIYKGDPKRITLQTFNTIKDLIMSKISHKVNNKSFKTKVFNNNDYIGTDYTAFLRRRDVDGNDFFIETKKGYSDPLYKAGIVKEVNDSEKLSNISLLDYDKVRETLVELFYNNQSVFITKDFVQY